jgi:hypothetical protein
MKKASVAAVSVEREAGTAALKGVGVNTKRTRSVELAGVEAMMLKGVGMMRGKARARVALLLAAALMLALGFAGCESKSGGSGSNASSSVEGGNGDGSGDGGNNGGNGNGDNGDGNGNGDGDNGGDGNGNGDGDGSKDGENNGGYKKEGGEIVNGFVLPPYPDPKANDSTLLGIDANNNGVRDDVERWLIFKYKDDHRIVTEIGFQGARAYQIAIQDPSKAKETTKLVEAAQACNSYFWLWAKYSNEPILLDHDIITTTAFKTVQFNTKERIKAFFAYDKALSGGVYRLPKTNKDYRDLCSFDADALLKETK